jgi:hypothetical protein
MHGKLSESAVDNRHGNQDQLKHSSQTPAIADQAVQCLQLLQHSVSTLDLPLMRRLRIPPDAGVEGPPGLLLKLPLPNGNLIGMDLVPLCQILPP